MPIEFKSSVPGARIEEAIAYLEDRKASAQRGIKKNSSVHQELVKRIDIKLEVLHQVLDGCLICGDCKQPDCPGCI